MITKLDIYVFITHVHWDDGKGVTYFKNGLRDGPFNLQGGYGSFSKKIF
jgi:phosphoribosyl 1,2-cyclic phosphodiesterase